MGLRGYRRNPARLSAGRENQRDASCRILEIVQPRRLAAVRRRVAIGGIGTAWRPALDQVWAFLKSQPGLRTDGHNVFLYHHPARPRRAHGVDFGVEVTRGFAAAGEVHPAEAPAGEVALAVHVGAYECLKETHDAIHAWAQAQQRAFAGQS